MENLCYHCALPVKNNKYTIYFENRLYIMCCPGCLAVFQFIVNAGLSDYYKNRENSGNKIDFLNKKNYNKINIFDDNNLNKKFVTYQTENISNIN